MSRSVFGMKMLSILFVCGRHSNHVCLSVTLKEELHLREVKGWKPHDEEEACSSRAKSVDSVPSVRNPLGSSVVIPHDA